MKKELDAYIVVSAALAAAISTLAFRTSQKRTMMEKDNIIGEVFVEVKNITFRYAGLPQKKIVKIFQNKFKPINLYCLCYMQGL